MFCTVADIEQFLQIEIEEEMAPAATRAIVEATAAIQNYCRQRLQLVEDETITLDCGGGTRVFLPELPVVEIVSVMEDGETLVATDDYKLGQHGILHRIGTTWASGIQIVEITYSHGYDELPEDLVAVCTRAAARAYQAGLRAEESEGIPGVTSKALGDYSVGYGAEGGGGMGEGVLGASAARMLLLSEKDVLNRYRV